MSKNPVHMVYEWPLLGEEGQCHVRTCWSVGWCGGHSSEIAAVSEKKLPLNVLILGESVYLYSVLVINTSM